MAKLLEIIGGLYRRFKFLAQSSKHHPADIENFKAIKTFCDTKRGELSDEDNLFKAVEICGSFIDTLARMLHREYKRKVLVIIDDYDVPLQKAVEAEEPYYDKMLEIIRQLSVSTFKQDGDP